MTMMRLLLICALFGLSLGPPAQAQMLPPLSIQETAEWRAVGVVNVGGAAGLAICSGTLVAPDLVLTAAHCVGTSSDVAGARYFNVGGIGARARISVPSAQILIHPDYMEAPAGVARFAVDLAVIQLAAPIEREIAQPVALFANDAGDVPHAIVAFHRLRPGLLSGRFDCTPKAGPHPNLRVLECPVVSGNSGGGVTVRLPETWALTGVAVARLGGALDGDASALVALIDPWVRAQVAQALARASK